MYAYDSFGRIYERSGISQNYRPLRTSRVGHGRFFTGREYDTNLQLYYYRARWYSPALGRFMSRDPLGYADGVNLYAYVGNNPTTFVDPWGLKASALIKNTVTYLPGFEPKYPNTTISSYDTPPTAARVNELLREHQMLWEKTRLDIKMGNSSLIGGNSEWINGKNKIKEELLTLCLMGAPHAECKNIIKNQEMEDEIKALVMGYTGGGKPRFNLSKIKSFLRGMLGKNGPRVISQTVKKWRGGGRLDIENPNPGVRPGQVHYQQVGDPSKYFFNQNTGRFHIGSSSGPEAPKAIQKLLNDPSMVDAIIKAFRILDGQ